MKEDDSKAKENRNPLDYQPEQQQLNVRIEPRIANVRVGESVLIRCITQPGREPIEISWYKSTPTNELIHETRILNNALVINSASYSDSGDYYCEGRNSQGSHKARSRLIVNQPEEQTRNAYNVDNQSLDNRNQANAGDSMNVIIPPTVHIIPERQTIIQGKSSTLRCVAEGNPTPKIVWSKARSELDPARHLIINGQNQSTLEIRDSTIGDRGLYVCRAENSGGRSYIG